MLPLHVPFEVVNSLPISGVPETTGGCVFDGAAATRFVAAKPAAARIASASAMTAAISSGLAIAIRRKRECRGTRSIVTSLLLTTRALRRSANKAAANLGKRSRGALDRCRTSP